MAGSKKHPNRASHCNRRFISIQHPAYNFESYVHSSHTQSTTSSQAPQRSCSQEKLEEILRYELQCVTYEGDWVANHFCPAPADTVEQVIEGLRKADIWEPTTKSLTVNDMKAWPGKKSDATAFHEPFTTLLNRIIEALAACYPAEYKRSYLGPVRFMAYAKTMQESVTEESSLKPDILALTEQHLSKRTASWYSTIFTGEVKSTWKKIVLQAGAYARCLFAASDHRIFIPILALHHPSSTFRLLLYHRSGLLATHAMELRTASGFKGLVSTIVGMWLWRKPSQAGYVPAQLPTYLSLNNTKYFIHAVICRRQSIRGRVTTVYLVDREEGLEDKNRYLAVPPEHCDGREWESLNPFDYHGRQPKKLEEGDEAIEDEDEEEDSDGGGHEDDDAVTQELNLTEPLPDFFIVKCCHQLPGQQTEFEVFSTAKGFIGVPDIVAKYDSLCFAIPADKTPTPWKVFVNKESDILPYESRVHKHVIIASMGQRLNPGLTFKQVGYALLHAMIGHCALFTEGGYLHRDISSGNIVSLVGCTRSDWKIPPLLQGIVTSNECSAVLIDGDVAKKWGSPTQDSDRLGTLPFVSARLANSWNETIVPTPIDDLESFAWVLLYDALAWTPANERTTTEDDWWEGINSETLRPLANFKKLLLLEADRRSRMGFIRDSPSEIIGTLRPLIHAWFLKSLEFSTLHGQLSHEKRGEREFMQLYHDAYKAFITVGVEQCAALPDLPIKSVYEQ